MLFLYNLLPNTYLKGVDAKRHIIEQKLLHRTNSQAIYNCRISRIIFSSERTEEKTGHVAELRLFILFQIIV